MTCSDGPGAGAGPTDDPPAALPGFAGGPAGGYGYGRAGAAETREANRGYWDTASATYLTEHGATLGREVLVWGPEGLDEDDARLLGDPAALAGAVVLEVGCGAGQGTRWARRRGARAVGVDLSAGMLAQGGALDVPPEPSGGVAADDAPAAGGAGAAGRPSSPPLLQADAGALPLATGCVDVAFSAYGALPFVADAGAVLAEVARVLRPGGAWVFSVTHPVRWAFPDDPGPGGLVADRSYFDRSPYVERDEGGRLEYAEHHRTLGDWVRLVSRTGFVLDDLVEPEWSGPDQPTWGGWSALRGAVLPGTAVFVTRRR